MEPRVTMGSCTSPAGVRDGRRSFFASAKGLQRIGIILEKLFESGRVFNGGTRLRRGRMTRAFRKQFQSSRRSTFGRDAAEGAEYLANSRISVGSGGGGAAAIES